MEIKHEGVCYRCDKCDYQIKHMRELLITAINVIIDQNKKSFNTSCPICTWKVEHKCPQCDYLLLRRGDLKHCIVTNHEGVSYNCNQWCTFKTNWQRYLKRHVKIKYEGNKNSCKQCHYKGKINKVLQNKIISTTVIFFSLVFGVVSNRLARITLENISR